MNNPFAYLIWMIFAMRMWNNQDGNQGNAIQSQLDAMRSQIADNQNSSLVMDAIADKDDKEFISSFIAESLLSYAMRGTDFDRIYGIIEKLL